MEHILLWSISFLYQYDRALYLFYLAPEIIVIYQLLFTNITNLLAYLYALYDVFLLTDIIIAKKNNNKFL